MPSPCVKVSLKSTNLIDVGVMTIVLVFGHVWLRTDVSGRKPSSVLMSMFDEHRLGLQYRR